MRRKDLSAQSSPRSQLEAPVNAGIELNDLLIKGGIDPKAVLVLRHRPWEPGLRRVLPWLAHARPEVFNAYQQAQPPHVEKAMSEASFVASFIGHEPGKALFVSLYKVAGSKPLTSEQFWEIPANIEMRAFGMGGFSDERRTILWFDLAPVSLFADWKEKLVVGWPGLERSWWRWAARNVIPVHAILEEGTLGKQMPPWEVLVLSRDELMLLPSKWQGALAHWRGIYLIVDVSDGKGYVGSAYGTENMLGRWLNYAATGHGGNKGLRGRDSRNLRFSILQRVSPDMDAESVIRLEGAWKDRLHTRWFGLNEN